MTTAAAKDQAFQQWLSDSQAIDLTTLTTAEAKEWRSIFDEITTLPAPKVGLMKLDKAKGNQYAVAIREGGQLWLTLWVRRNPKGEIFILYPRSDEKWDAHASYHRDGRIGGWGTLPGSTRSIATLPDRPVRIPGGTVTTAVKVAGSQTAPIDSPPCPM